MLGKTNASALIGIQDSAVSDSDWERGPIPQQARKRSLTPAIARAVVSIGLRFNISASFS